MQQDGDTVTFTAIKTGETTITYTVDGVEYSITITITDEEIPLVKKSSKLPVYVALGVAALVCAAGAGALMVKKRRGHSQK